MCFSATASFIAAGVLCAAGIGVLRMTSRPAQIPFASIPLLFGIQQFTEGMIWLSFRNESPLSNATLTFFYSLFSHVLWPIYVPFAVALLEKTLWRKRALAACQIAGVLVGVYLLYYLVQFPVTSQIVGKHIAYESPHFYRLTVMALYLIATCLSGVLSSNKIIREFGALAFVTFIAAYAIHVATFFSVWCFFAAILSFIVYVHAKQVHFVAAIA